MKPVDLHEMTLAQFNNALEGWSELRKGENLEDWRRTRSLGSFVLAIGQWKDGRAPDIMRILPLPGDPEDKSAELIEISDEDMALRKYKLKKARKIRFNDEYETLVRRHWQPEWGPHPDEIPIE